MFTGEEVSQTKGGMKGERWGFTDTDRASTRRMREERGNAYTLAKAHVYPLLIVALYRICHVNLVSEKVMK